MARKKLWFTLNIPDPDRETFPPGVPATAIDLFRHVVAAARQMGDQRLLLKRVAKRARCREGQVFRELLRLQHFGLIEVVSEGEKP